jgi:hypothetical protein
MALHSTLTGVELHGVQSLVYANFSARISATGFVPSDVGKIARQLDDDSFWILLNHSPVVWKILTGSVAAQVAKAGILVPGDFSGSPKKAHVTFGTGYPNTDYSVTASVLTDGSKTFALEVENKTTEGFTVNLGSNNLANLVEVDWHTMANAS